MNNIHNEILELYQELYGEVKEANTIKKRQCKLTICPAVAGANYTQGGLMFIGRAINSWCPLEESLTNDNIKERIALCEKCTLGWVVGDNNWSHCRNNGCRYAQKEGRVDGRKNNTPFWQMVQYICQENGLENDWYKQIVWSNLYKASYTRGDNPTGFYRQQIDLCNKLLIKEIEFYQPRAIYFITEKNSKETATKDNRVWFCEQYNGTNIHFAEVYQFLKGKKIDVYVLTRPEFQVKEEIYKARQDLEGNTTNA